MAILVMSVVGILLATTGVPIYSVMFAMEANAIPFEIGNLGHLGTQVVSPASTIGDIVGYELWHWGAYPPVNIIVSAIAGAITGLGVSFLGPWIVLLAHNIAASGAVTIGSISDIILTTIGGISVGPVGWPVIGAIASAVVAA